MSFARTKIQPPRPRAGALIERPALERRLLAALHDRRLVLLCAPAGFGKTSALARALAALPPAVALAWVSCDEDDTPAQLFECLLGALEPHDVPWRSAPDALVRAAAEAVTPALRRQITVQFINALDACEVERGLIVVDDLHRAGRPEVHEFLDQLLERLGERWCLVLSTREVPPLALPRLRARGELAEFGPADLRFDLDEVRALAGAAAAGDEASRLHARTQGWPAGLRLALNAPRAPGAGAAIDRAVFDFLAAEVIDRLEPGLREFLLAVSLLPELDAARCAAVSGDTAAAERLEQIDRAGLFVGTLSAGVPTWRLHDLFREALQSRLQRERPEDWRRFAVRAAAAESDTLRALALLVRVQAWDEAEERLTDDAEETVARGQAAALQELLERLPRARREASPRLLMVRAMLAGTRWDWSPAIDATARAAAAWQAAGDGAGARRARSYHAIALAGANLPEARACAERLLGEPELEDDARARALLVACWLELRGGDQRRIAPQWHELVARLEGQRSLARWYECCPLPPFVGLPGMRGALQRSLDGAFARVPEHPTPLRGMSHVVQGWLHLWRGDVAAAETEADAAAADARWLARPVNVDAFARTLQAVLLALRGRAAEALAAIGTVRAEVETSEQPFRARVYGGVYRFVAMRCAAIVGDDHARAEAARALAAIDDAAPGWMSAPQRSGAAAHLAEIAGDLAGAAARWRALLADEHRADLYGQVAEARLRLADLLHRLGRPAAEAAAALKPLFARIDADGEPGVTLMAGPAVLRRLADADWAAALPPADRGRLAAWAAAAEGWRRAAAAANTVAATHLTASPAPQGPQPPSADGPLSARELEVLRCIAAGDSNKLIARALDLSPHTVKRHVANILDKLALETRGQAADWYRRRHG